MTILFTLNINPNNLEKKFVITLKVLFACSHFIKKENAD